MSYSRPTNDDGCPKFVPVTSPSAEAVGFKLVGKNRIGDALYNRATPYSGRSLAFASFARDHVELNEFYWSGAAAMAAVSGLTRHWSHPDDYRTKLSLDPARFGTALPHTVELYTRDLVVSQRWHRRTALIALASLLEKYMIAAASTALASDPLLLGGFPLVFDGITLMKRGIKAPKLDVADIARGDWSARLAAFARLFGSVPVNLRAVEGPLEKMRQTRNKIAHGFASDDDARTLTSHGAVLAGLGHQTQKPSRISVSEKELVKYLGAVYDAAAAIDLHLCSRHIGAYEWAAIYLEWERNPIEYERQIGVNVWKTGLTRDKNARRFLKHVTGVNSFDQAELTSLKAYISSC